MTPNNVDSLTNLEKRASFANQNHPNELFTCKMSNSYLLKANTLKNMNKDLNLAILLIPVANFRHQSLLFPHAENFLDQKSCGYYNKLDVV